MYGIGGIGQMLVVFQPWQARYLEGGSPHAA
jgi:hypothetical protein